MIDFSDAYSDIENSDLSPWMEQLPAEVEATFARYSHGELTQWHKMLDELIDIDISEDDISKARDEMWGSFGENSE